MIDDPVSGFGFLGLDSVYARQGWEMRVKTRQERGGVDQREIRSGLRERKGERGKRRSPIFIYIYT
jgi:hypothetical protein